METQSENKVSSQQTKLKKVLEKINEIAEEADTGDYIYRGEPECYGEVYSSLYREYEVDIKAQDFDIAVIQEEILKEAKEYTHKTNEFEILAELHYHGGRTNLIEFTTDYLVALFSLAMVTLTKPVELYCSKSSLKLTMSGLPRERPLVRVSTKASSLKHRRGL